MRQVSDIHQRAPRHIRILMTHTAPQFPGHDADEATQRAWLAEVAEHVAAFDNLVKALERVNNKVARSLSGRVH